MLIIDCVAFGQLTKSNTKKQQYKLDSDYKNNIDRFIHVNKNCKLCMTSRSANAGCVIPKNKKILLVRDNYSKKLGLPGGMKKKYETAVMTAIRETLEETGFIVYIDDFISEFKNGFRLYKCKIIADTKKTDGEISEFKYVDKKELKELLKKENRKNIRFPHELELVYSKFDYIIQ